jgi:hypothetical protein
VSQELDACGERLPPDPRWEPYTGKPHVAEHEAWFPEDTEVVDVFSPPSNDDTLAVAPLR